MLHSSAGKGACCASLDLRWKPGIHTNVEGSVGGGAPSSTSQTAKTLAYTKAATL